MVHDIKGLVLLFHMEAPGSSLLARLSVPLSSMPQWVWPLLLLRLVPEWRVIAVPLIGLPFVLLRGSELPLPVWGLSWVLGHLLVHLGRIPWSSFMRYCVLAWRVEVLWPSLLDLSLSVGGIVLPISFSFRITCLSVDDKW
jgi:hypothetical protein